VGRVEREIYKAYLSAWSTTFIALPVIVAFMAFGERGLQVGQQSELSTRLWSIQGSILSCCVWVALCPVLHVTTCSVGR
jgi:hypothetical protein